MHSLPEEKDTFDRADGAGAANVRTRGVQVGREGPRDSTVSSRAALPMLREPAHTWSGVLSGERGGPGSGPTLSLAALLQGHVEAEFSGEGARTIRAAAR